MLFDRAIIVSRQDRDAGTTNCGYRQFAAISSDDERVDAVDRVAVVISNRRVERSIGQVVRIRVIDRLGMGAVVVMVCRTMVRVSPDMYVGCFVNGVVRSAAVVGMGKCKGDPLIGHYQQDYQQIGKPTNHRALKLRQNVRTDLP